MLAEDVRAIAGRAKAGEEYKAFDAVGPASSGRPGSSRRGPADLLAWDDLLGRLEWAAVALVEPGPGPGRASARTSWSAGSRTPGGSRPWSASDRAEIAAVAPWVAPLRSAEESGLAAARRRSEAFDRAWRRLRDRLVAPGSPVELACAGRVAAGRAGRRWRPLVPEGEGHDPAITALRELADGLPGVDRRRA